MWRKNDAFPIYISAYRRNRTTFATISRILKGWQLAISANNDPRRRCSRRDRDREWERMTGGARALLNTLHSLRRLRGSLCTLRNSEDTLHQQMNEFPKALPIFSPNILNITLQYAIHECICFKFHDQGRHGKKCTLSLPKLCELFCALYWRFSRNLFYSFFLSHDISFSNGII